MTERTYGGRTVNQLGGDWKTGDLRGLAAIPDMLAHIRELQAEVARLAEERDNWASKFREEEKIVSRIWEILGNPTYEQLAGRSIYDLIARLAEGEMRMREAAAQTAHDQQHDNPQGWSWNDACVFIEEAIRALPLSADAGETR